MAFGMKNSPAIFQRLLKIVAAGLDDCKAYFDDVLLYRIVTFLGQCQVKPIDAEVRAISHFPRPNCWIF